MLVSFALWAIVHGVNQRCTGERLAPNIGSGGAPKGIDGVAIGDIGTKCLRAMKCACQKCGGRGQIAVINGRYAREGTGGSGRVHDHAILADKGMQRAAQKAKSCGGIGGIFCGERQQGEGKCGGRTTDGFIDAYRGTEGWGQRTG